MVLGSLEKPQPEDLAHCIGNTLTVFHPPSPWMGEGTREACPPVVWRGVEWLEPCVSWPPSHPPFVGRGDLRGPGCKGISVTLDELPSGWAAGSLRGAGPKARRTARRRGDALGGSLGVSGGELALVHEAVVDGVADDLGVVLQAQFRQDPASVHADGLDAERQLGRNGLHGLP